MRPVQRLLNFSTHPKDLALIQNNWTNARKFLEYWDFDGFELYPTVDYPCRRIPAAIICGLHLHFFVILAPIWRNDPKRMLEIFGNWETVDLLYGGRDARCITKFYTRQLDLAQHLGCGYVVFHPVHYELDYVYNWQPPWKMEETLELCAEVINSALAASLFDGLLLFENLWWPGNFRLDSPDEFDYLLERINYPRCGIALDTGHLLNKNPQLAEEESAIDYLLSCIEHLGRTARHIHTIHLSKSLTGDYIRKTKEFINPFKDASTFWDRFDLARRHVQNIDRHESFELPQIAAVLEKVEPANVVFEFSYKSMAEWEQKIATQKQALQNFLW